MLKETFLNSNDSINIKNVTLNNIKRQFKKIESCKNSRRINKIL